MKPKPVATAVTPAGPFEIVALKSTLAPFTLEIDAALRRGVPMTPDPRRSGFFELNIDRNWYYIHVNQLRRTVYLIAAASR